MLLKSRDLRTETVYIHSLNIAAGRNTWTLFSWSSNSLSLLLDAIAPFEGACPHSPGLDDLRWDKTYAVHWYVHK